MCVVCVWVGRKGESVSVNASVLGGQGGQYRHPVCRSKLWTAQANLCALLCCTELTQAHRVLALPYCAAAYQDYVSLEQYVLLLAHLGPGCCCFGLALLL